MEKLRFEIGFKKYIFWSYPSALVAGIIFLCFDWSFLGYLILALLAFDSISLIWKFFKLQKLKSLCHQSEKGVYEIPFSEIKEIIPVNIQEDVIHTHTGKFRITPFYIKNHKTIKAQIHQKMEEEPFLKIETPVSPLTVLLIIFVVYEISSILITKRNFEFELNGLIISFLFIYIYYSTSDLIFKINTNSFFKKIIKIPVEQILSYQKSSELITLNTTNKSMWLCSEYIGTKRIESFLEKNGIPKTPTKEMSTFRYLIMIFVIVLIVFSVFAYLIYSNKAALQPQ